MTNILIVGCGLSGSVIAERLATKLNKNVTIIEKRNHIGGNCYDFVDETTGILMNKYGAHLFHTNNERVWEYINKFSEWIRWEHKVVSLIDNTYVSIPVNITTINQLCGEHLQNKKDVDEWLKKNQIKYENITNSEEMAKSRIGNILYDKLIKEYTYKQWNVYPNELDKSVLARIPIRPDFDTRYFSDKYQVLPKYSYTKFFENMLDNKNIRVILNTDYFEHIKENKYDFIIFTGQIDAYFNNFNLEKLEYRSIDFQTEIIKNTNFYQPNSVVNYPEPNVPYTRIVEYKHFLNQQSKHTLIVKETTNDYGEPYYPVPNKKNIDLYEKYKELANLEEKKNVFFVGRLANYKYFNMDEAILNSLEFFDKLEILI
jgi:UDP-galactopyranose mutase